jgi:hypothetical protein
MESGMISYARLTPGPGFRPMRAFFYYVQRLVTAAPLRRLISGGIAAMIRLRHGKSGSPRMGAVPDDLLARDVVSALDRDGLTMVTDIAGPDARRIERIVRFFADKPVLGPKGMAMPLDRLPAGTAAAAYPLETVLECQDVLDIVNAPAVLRIATTFLGCTPTLSSLGVRWSFPAAATPTDTQKFHRDLDDWRFLKLFIYLTDVDAEAGPHIYVMGSHRETAELRARLYSRDGLAKRYGEESLKTVTGARGTAFIAATHGIHMGMPPATKPRLILQAQYSLLPVFAFRYRPIALAAPPCVDSYVNRLLIANLPSPRAAGARDVRSLQPVSRGMRSGRA